MAPARMRFAHQVLVLQIGLLTLVVAVGSLVAAWMESAQLVGQYGQQAINIARTVASDVDLADAVAHDDTQAVQTRAERARLGTGALFVVVTDENGIRLAHPNASLVGQHVSTDPSQALNGHEVVNVERGTLGLSARGKVPLRDRAGTIVGEVSVGIDAAEIDATRWRQLGMSALFGGVALLLGAFGALLLTRLLKRRTLGLEPRELAELMQEHQAVLHGIGEGVLAVDAAGTVSVCNGEARRLLSTQITPGIPLTELELPPRLRAALEHRERADNLVTVAGDRVLVANYRDVTKDGRDLGGVLTLRDRTDLEVLTRELDTTRALTDALRAQRHEFANRMHTLTGLLRTRHYREATEYLDGISTGPIVLLGSGGDLVEDPYLQAFLSAKTSAAAEQGIELRVGGNSWVPAKVIAPLEVTTVVGNLVDNALEAAQLGSRRPAAVEVDLLAEGTTLHVAVTDSGDGVADHLRDSLFVEGVSTKDGHGRGIGLALTRQAARSLGGDVRLAEAGGTERGALFLAELPQVLEARSGRTSSDAEPLASQEEK
ncbi:sensor histidine kinase [Saccharopolyspora sp. WRP15-2]|uniref:histidine kinase n=1 Tax=Saccharopolyspora oryzae TaxID=2997343 RepID=A0ABT4V8T7_9PSEU|nr:sensor histidine kinase [Saccharopolyspora oryzae]MDA3630370.1 sensor histidine kinase [Saccharopolyspora oryzae]